MDKTRLSFKAWDVSRCQEEVKGGRILGWLSSEGPLTSTHQPCHLKAGDTEAPKNLHVLPS